MEEKKQTMIQSLQTGLGLLEIVAKEEKPLKFTEIQQKSDMTKSNLYKYLTTLQQSGFLYRDPISNTYKLGNKLIEFSHLAQKDTAIIDLASPYMKAFTEETGLTALLALPSLEGPIIKKIWSVTYGINIGAQIGTVLPLLSSTGMIFYSYKEGLLIDGWIEQALEEMPAATKQALEKEANRIKEQSFISKNEPLVEHISSCSVPVMNFRGDLTAAITVVGYKHFIPKNPDNPIVQKLLHISRQLSE